MTDKKLLEKADLLLMNKFVFDNIWAMEPFITVKSNYELDWQKKYYNDDEWTYMLNRFEYLYKLVYAYEITRLDKYMDKGMEFINNWYTYHKYTRGIPFFNKKRFFKKRMTSNRSLDLSIKAINIYDFLVYFEKKGKISSKDMKKYLLLLEKDIEFAYSCRKRYKIKSNWSLIEDLNFCYFYKKTNNARKLNEHMHNVEFELDIQILNNGSHIESSPMYLVQILLCLLKLLTIYESNPKIYFYCKKITNYLTYIRTPENTIPNIGDSDATNISDIMIVASILLKNQHLMDNVNKELDFEFRFKYNLMNETFNYNCYIQSKIIMYLDDQFVINDSLSGFYLFGYNTKKESGHKHCDNQSLIVYYQSIPLLIDMGRFTYKNSKERSFYVSPMYHNTFTVKKDSYVYQDSWNFCDFTDYSSIYTNMKIYKDFIIAKMTRNVKGTDTSRFVILNRKNQEIIIADLIENVDISYKSYFNFDSNVRFKQISENELLLYVKNYKLFFKTNCIIYTNDSLQSRHYNQTTNTKSIVCESNFFINVHHISINSTYASIDFSSDEIKIHSTEGNIDYYFNMSNLKLREEINNQNELC